MPIKEPDPEEIERRRSEHEHQLAQIRHVQLSVETIMFIDHMCGRISPERRRDAN